MKLSCDSTGSGGLASGHLETKLNRDLDLSILAAVPTAGGAEISSQSRPPRDNYSVRTICETGRYQPLARLETHSPLGASGCETYWFSTGGRFGSGDNGKSICGTSRGTPLSQVRRRWSSRSESGTWSNEAGPRAKSADLDQLEAVVTRMRFAVILSLSAISMVSWARDCFADNPIIQTNFTADPAPMVYNDTLYLYTSHDEDTAVNFVMYNWMLYTTTDMVNWTDHGIVAGVRAPNNTFPWAAGSNAWAPQVIEKNGKFYLYAPIQGAGAMTIAVAVADSPFGPFKDALGKSLVSTGTSDDIDPTVYIDSDGKAYLYWGNPNCHYVTLNADMISYSGSIGTTPKIQTYQEGPWFYRRDNNYYLAFASTCCPEGIGYAMSSSPTGPWTYKGSVMDGNTNSSGNHPGIVDFKGNSYVFGFNYYLNNNLTNGTHQERRSISVAQFTYNADGTISKLPWWTLAGPAQIGHLDPYVQTEAETIAWESGAGTKTCTSPTDYNNCWKTGVRTEVCSDTGGGMDVTSIQNGSFIKVKGVDFGLGATSLDVRVASAGSGGNIEVRLESQTGTLVGTCAVSGTGGAQTWVTKSCAISGASGVHDLFFVFTGGSGSLFNFNWWKFSGDPGGDAGVGTGGWTSNGGGPSAGGTGGANGGAGGRGTAVSSGGTTSVVSTGAGGGNTSGGQATGGRLASGGATSVMTGSGGNAGTGGRLGSGGATSVAIGGGAIRTTGGTNAATTNGSGTGGNNGPSGGVGGTTVPVAAGGTLPANGGSNAALAAGGGPPPDAGIADGNAANTSGCKCTLPGRTRTGPGWIWSLASLLAVRLAQRRSRAKRGWVT
jgi:arabinoxylan arabinofuranohydrolase